MAGGSAGGGSSIAPSWASGFTAIGGQSQVPGKMGGSSRHPGSSGGDGRINIAQGPKDDTHKGNRPTVNPNNVKIEDPLKKYTSSQSEYYDVRARTYSYNEGLEEADGVFFAIYGMVGVARATFSKVSARISTLIIKSATKNAVKKNLVEILGIEDDIITFSAKFGEETVEGIANFTVNEGKLFLEGLHLQGSQAGKVGREALWSMAKDLGKQFNVKEVVIQGAKRTTGKFRGQIPSQITIVVE